MTVPLRGAVVLALALAALGIQAPVARQGAGRSMAVTFDDLPYVAVGSPDYVRDARRATSEIVRALNAHHAPATGFVNEINVQVPGQIDARIGFLQQWIDAGAVLGNHTYSHADLNALTVEQFEDEIVRGDVVTRRLMERRRPYQLYFRHPMTHTGDTSEKKQAVEAFLAARGYKVTPHTIENSDFIFNVPYVKALRAHDTTVTARLAQAYVEFTLAATTFAENVSPKIFGREIPQTLLIHANDLNADCLEKLLTGFESRGYRFISLDEAMSDQAYKTADTLVSRSGPTWLWRWMKSKGMNVSFRDDPEPPAWVTELYRAR